MGKSTGRSRKTGIEAASIRENWDLGKSGFDGANHPGYSIMGIEWRHNGNGVMGLIYIYIYV